MKLESCSHSKATNVKSLATVKEVCGARVLLHFDGTHSNLDVWKLCDSADIFPAGWREGSKLKAPIGMLLAWTLFLKSVWLLLKCLPNFSLYPYHWVAYKERVSACFLKYG